VEQLASPLYLVPHKQSEQWVKEEQILPLLDGLDEMDETARPACIAAINAYRSEHPLSPLVVCSRSDEYQAATSTGRLSLSCAVEVQLLTSAQLDKVLLQAGRPASALRSELQKNEKLLELARTPLWLNVLLLTFRNTSVHALPQQSVVLQQKICEHYVQRMIEEKGDHVRYTLEQTTHWLTFLAKQMRTQNRAAFGVELLQPDWLPRGSHMGYRWSVGLVFGFLGVLISGLLGLTTIQIEGPSGGLFFMGPSGGLVLMLVIVP